MDLISTCPLRAATLLWQSRPNAWVLTVSCKATFLLQPGECPLAPEQEALVEADEHWNDDPSRSVRAADELVPVKPRADILLIGYAFAPAGALVRSVVARLVAGEVDKSIEVHNDRVLSPTGAVQEGGPFSRQQLTYERAAGGPGTWNPAGIATEARDPYGRRILPNIVSPGTQVADMVSAIEPIGFGPIGATWPSRMERLGPRAARFPPGAFREWPLPEGLDRGYFNQAPRDQQLTELRDKLPIVLENLHPEHPRLITSLPGIKPAIFVLRPRNPAPQRLALRADTLCIDTERGLVTLVFRGQLPLEHRDENIRIAVFLQGPGHETSLAEAGRAFMTGAAPADGEEGALDGTMTLSEPSKEMLRGAPIPFAVTPTTPRDASSSPPAAGVLPFQSAPTAPLMPFPVVAAPVLPASPLAAFEGSTMPPPVAPPRAPAVSSPWIQAAPPPVVAAPETPWAAGGSDLGPQRETVGMALAASASTAVATPNLEEGARAGAAAASDAAAGVSPPFAPKLVPRAPLGAAAASFAGTSAVEALTLLWYEPESLARVRRHAGWRPVLDALEKKPLDRELDDPALSGDPTEAEDRREIFEILAHGAPMDARGVEEAFAGAIRDDGKLVPPLVLLAGDLETPFDELATLRATLSCAVPHVTPADEGLKAAISTAKEFLATPDLAAAPAVCEGITARIREAFQREKRALPSDLLHGQVERFLLAGRHYQRREVLGEMHIRVLLWLPGEPSSLVGYLPAAPTKKLPMWRRSRMRVIAGVHPAQDQYESQPRALRIVAIAREGSGGRPPARS